MMMMANDNMNDDDNDDDYEDGKQHYIINNQSKK